MVKLGTQPWAGPSPTRTSQSRLGGSAKKISEILTTTKLNHMEFTALKAYCQIITGQAKSVCIRVLLISRSTRWCIKCHFKAKMATRFQEWHYNGSISFRLRDRREGSADCADCRALLRSTFKLLWQRGTLLTCSIGWWMTTLQHLARQGDTHWMAQIRRSALSHFLLRLSACSRHTTL